jgi:hypothetical protein
MIKLDNKRVLAVSLVAAALVGMSATSASAAPQTNGSEAPVYLYDAGNNDLFDATSVHEFEYDVVGGPSATDVEARFTCSADTTTLQTFISPVGSEKDKGAWIAFADSFFHPDHPLEFMQYPMTLSGNTEGAPLSIKAAGGAYSAGIACLKDNDVNFAASGLWFSTIDVTPVTGKWTARAVDGPGTPVPTPAQPQTADIAITAQTIAAAEGVLSLNVTTGAAATIGNPTLVNGVSTSTGKLGEFTVTDGRVAGKKGWNLTATVADFVGTADATNTIPAAQLGVAPKVVRSSTTDAKASDAQVAGSAKFPAKFAGVPLGTTVAETVLDADLTFVAPADKAAGTYTSKMTLTLTSN